MTETDDVVYSAVARLAGSITSSSCSNARVHFRRIPGLIESDGRTREIDQLRFLREATRDVTSICDSHFKPFCEAFTRALRPGRLLSDIKDAFSRSERHRFVMPFASIGNSSAPASRRRKQARKRGLSFLANVVTSAVDSKQETKDQEEEEAPVLVHDYYVKDMDGNDLEDKEMYSVAMNCITNIKRNWAFTSEAVKADVDQIMDSGYFAVCNPDAEDSRDGALVTYKVEVNQEMKGLVTDGADVLPSVVVEKAFKDEFGKVFNSQRIYEVLNKVNEWYRERGYFGQVADINVLSDGVLRLQVAEAAVNNINIRFLDRKTGEPTIGHTRLETIMRQLTTKKGQVYSLQQARRDAETVYTMGIMEDVNLIPSPAAGSMVDLTMNCVERPPGGFSAGGGISGNSVAGGGLLSGMIGSLNYTNRNLLGRNQKLTVSLERGQLDSMFRINYTDPWLDNDAKRTARAVNIQNSRSPGTSIFGTPRDEPNRPMPWHGGINVSRLVAGVDFSRPLRPKCSGTAGLSLQRAGVRDDHGQPILLDNYGGPLTFSGQSHDDMLVAKLEVVFTDSGDNGSSQVVINTEQGIPVQPNFLFFNRLNARVRQGFRLGQLRLIASGSGGHVFGDLPPHEAFPIGGTNSVRGYDEGAVGSGRSYLVGSAELSYPIVGPVEGAVFCDYGTDMESGRTVPGDPAGVRGRPGKGYGYGGGIRIDSPLGPLRLEYAFNDHGRGRFHFGIGHRN